MSTPRRLAAGVHDQQHLHYLMHSAKARQPQQDGNQPLPLPPPLPPPPPPPASTPQQQQQQQQQQQDSSSGEESGVKSDIRIDGAQVETAAGHRQHQPHGAAAEPSHPASSGAVCVGWPGPGIKVHIQPQEGNTTALGATEKGGQG
eukprot:scaffold78577_cov19-Tisochrysis_lutea.AAC.5